MQEILWQISGQQPIVVGLALILAMATVIFLIRKIIKIAMLTAGAVIILLIASMYFAIEPQQIWQVLSENEKPVLEKVEDVEQEVKRQLREKSKEMLYEALFEKK